jgi:predicted metal-dependent enzyme (double-stranded beta helix superfamily)
MNADALPRFIAGMNALVESTRDEPTLLAQARQLLAPLLANDQWLPADCARALPDRYAQYLLHADPRQRFSVVSFVWGPGQKTPVHDHTVWGLVGMLRGAERCEEFELVDGVPRATGQSHVMRPGQIEAVSPTVGDWHRVSNALTDQASISIHVYGADIGQVRRHHLNAQGQVAEFVSGYTAR